MRTHTSVLLIATMLFSSAACSDDSKKKKSQESTTAASEKSSNALVAAPSKDEIPTPATDCMPLSSTDRDQLGCGVGETSACNGRTTIDRDCGWISFCDAPKALLLPEDLRPRAAADSKVEFEVKINDEVIDQSKYVFRADDGVLIFPAGDGPAKRAAISISVHESPAEESATLCD